MDPNILETARGSKWRRILVRAASETTPVTVQPHPHDSVDFKRVKLSMRDWLIAIVFLVGNTLAVVLWIDNRFGRLETDAKVQAREIEDLRTARTDTNSKLDAINSTLTGLAVKVAEIATTKHAIE